MYTEATYALLTDALVRPFIPVFFSLSFWEGLCGSVVSKTLVANLLGIAFRRPALRYETCHPGLPPGRSAAL